MATDESFPEADVQAELNPGQNKNFEADPVSSEIASKKEQKKAAQQENAKAKKNAAQTLKSAIILSAVVVAVAGAAFAISKKLRDK